MGRVHGRTQLLPLLCLLALAQRSGAAEPQSLQQQIDAALGTAGRGTTAALVVEELRGDRLYAANADAPLKPASVLKLFTTAAALIRLGPDFQFPTNFLLLGRDLVVIGGGDPGLGDVRICAQRGEKVTAVFDRLAAALKSRAISDLESVAIDDGIFDQQVRHPDWPDDQQDDWYQAPVGGVNYNDNCLDAVARLEKGQPVLALTPDLPATFFKNQLRTTGKGAPSVSRPPESDIFLYAGLIQKTTAFEPAAVREPTIFFGHALKAELENRGIAVRGAIVRREVTPEVRVAAQVIGKEQTALSAVLWRANAFSQNLFAECLLKAIAAYGPNGAPSGHAGSWDRGAFVLRKTLADADVNLEGAVIRDGSGLSHENRVSAAQIVRLLQVMHRHSEAAAFRASLAQPGKPGTLQRGYAHASLAGRMWAKTGTIANVRTLAGYIKRPDGKELAFALLINGPGGGELRVKVARILAEAPLRSGE